MKGKAMNDRPTLMILDDEKETVEQFQLLLESVGNYRVVPFLNPREALTFLKETGNELPAAIIADIAMPEMDGYAFGAEVRRDFRLGHIPFIYLSARTAFHDKARARTITPHFFPKDGDRRELLSIIQSVLNEHLMQSGMNPLTRLPGNLVIERTVNELVAGGADFCVYYADCDNFKAYNDAYGTCAGDRAIQEVASALDRALRARAQWNYFLGHVGGDDFVAATWRSVDPRHVCDLVFSEMEKVRRSLYSASDIGRGYFEARNRKGEMERYGLLSISIGVVTSATRHVSGWAEASNLLAEVKKKAKAQPGNSYWIDARTEPL